MVVTVYYAMTSVCHYRRQQPPVGGLPVSVGGGLDRSHTRSVHPPWHVPFWHEEFMHIGMRYFWHKIL